MAGSILHFLHFHHFRSCCHRPWYKYSSWLNTAKKGRFILSFLHVQTFFSQTMPPLYNKFITTIHLVNCSRQNVGSHLFSFFSVPPQLLFCITVSTIYSTNNIYPGPFRSYHLHYSYSPSYYLLPGLPQYPSLRFLSNVYLVCNNAF